MADAAPRPEAVRAEPGRDYDPAPRRGMPHEPGTDPLLARLWAALGDVEDPEIPVSVVDMGLVLDVAYDATKRVAQLRITYTAMGCPAMDMIQDDMRARLLREPEVDRVQIEVVWDPVWTPRRLSQQAREAMRELGIGA